MSLPLRVLKLAGVQIPYRTRYADTFRYFGAYDSTSAAPDPAPDPVYVRDKDWEEHLAAGMVPGAYSEYSLLTFPVSDALMDLNRVVIHGVALRWRDRAWLICAESGVGKSTQARWLRELRPGEFGIISGDRPILEFPPAPPSVILSAAKNPFPPPPASILVHPSPWNGKENWYGAPAAELAGVILLRRGEQNRLYALSPEEAAISLYTKLLQTAYEPQRLIQAAAYATRILEQVPLWQLLTHRPPDSTQLLLEAVFRDA